MTRDRIGFAFDDDKSIGTGAEECPGCQQRVFDVDVSAATVRVSYGRVMSCQKVAAPGTGSTVLCRICGWVGMWSMLDQRRTKIVEE
jgi:hypothetical protein